MSDTTNNKNVRDDEIDLLDLFRRMGRGLGKMFSTIGRWALISIVFLFRNWLPLTISIVLGIGAGFIMSRRTPSSFTADLTLKVNIISTSDMISYINRLHTYCKEDNIDELANALAMQESQLKNIIDISAFWIIDRGRDGIPDIIDYKDNHNIYDTVNIRMQDRIAVRVRINAPQELGNIKEGILRFIKSDSLFEQRNRLRMNQNRDLLARIDYDIEQLDSLQKVKYFEETRSRIPQNGGQMIFLQEQKTQLVYGDIYALYERKLGLETESNLYSGIVTVLSDFSIPALRENGVSFYSKKYIPIFFCLTFLVLIAIAQREKIKEIFRKY
jgi:hypothetical protein